MNRYRHLFRHLVTNPTHLGWRSDLETSCQPSSHGQLIFHYPLEQLGRDRRERVICFPLAAFALRAVCLFPQERNR